MTSRELQILQHTLGADEFGRVKFERNHYCADPDSEAGRVCRQMVTLGLMTDSGPVAYTGGAHYFRATPRGVEAVKKESKTPPARTRSQRRYEEYLKSDSGIPFIDWLKVRAKSR